jgi:O-antigen/teichoic acid export membrane protein
VLAVIWSVLGYFGVFDLGLSRATANQIARMRDDIPVHRERVFWTALSVNASLGILGGIVLLLFGHLLLGHVLKISPELRSEAVSALPWLSAAVPFTTITLVLAGTLEGLERFLTVNLLSTAGIAMFQLFPLAYAYWIGTSLSGLIMFATLGMFASTLLSFSVTAISLPVSRRPRIELGRLGSLIKYGGWVTISGLVSPILTIFDRVAIGAVLGAQAVTRYTVPFTLVSRTQILSTALARTLFPRLSILERYDAAGVGRDSLRVLVAVMTPITVIGVIALEPFLRVWIGPDLAADSAPVGEILLLGMWLNSMAVVPYVFLQAQGRPDLPAKFHVLEVLPYVGGLVLALHLAGIRGAAWAWAARAGVDAVLLFWAARAGARGADFAPLQSLVAGGALVMASCALVLLSVADTAVMILGGALVAASIWWGWRNTPDRVQQLLLARGALARFPSFALKPLRRRR